MTELTDEEKVQIARRSLAFYIGWAGKTDMADVSEGHMVPKPHHMQMINRLQEIAPIILQQEGWRSFGQERHTVIVAPPGSAKTTILRHFYEWILGNASLYMPNWANSFHVGHISHSEAQAKRMSLSVRNTIDGTDLDSGPVFRICFPDVKKSDKWSETEWRIEGCTGIWPTYAALGIDGSLPGFRWNFMGLDDLIKPERVRESNVTPADVEAVIYTVEQVGMERLVEGGCAALTNTRWFERDPTSWALDQGWMQVLIKALNEDNESFWEERQVFTAETLIARRERDPEGFALQFQGEPAPESGIDFKREWLRYTYDELPWKDALDKAENWRIVVSWDTAGTISPRSDETAGWTAAVNLRTEKIYLLDLYHGKLEFPDLLDTLRGNNMFWNPCVIWVEDKSTGTAAIQTLLLEGIPVEGVDAYGQRGSHGKLDVIVKQIQPKMAEGKVLFPTSRYAQTYDMEWLGDAAKALLMYPRGLHDDIPRALIQLIYETILGLQTGRFDEPPEEELGWGETTGERLVV